MPGAHEKTLFWLDAKIGFIYSLTLRIVPNPERFSSVFYPARAHASFTAVPLAMTAGAPSVMLIVA